MTEPSAQRPVPGPPRPGPVPPAAPASPSPAGDAAQERSDAEPAGSGRLAGLDGRPVSEHVAVFEAENERLQRELGTIDPL
ncbi:hypothetical protein [Blastococcus saxobsidens]|uniref:Uncharacterized protein n=1 Tax=Blastococcus saxobsidens TaxID=138336 RepID=A0A4Q7Y673_9ACTN|nr:hypothetical protein [Blastococcus saxobsidens]RZU31601.1 hypothetical protein BKA19_1276 [Blastococcus saxobsidens]